MYIICGKLLSNGKSHVVDDDIQTLLEARELLLEYRLAFGPEWELYIVGEHAQKA